MKPWMLTLLLGLALLVPPVVADDEENDGSKTPTTQEAKVETKEAKESPILHLAELRIDEYVIAARAMNLPLPGRTKTLQDILDRLDEWSKDEQVGAVLLDINFVLLSLPDVQELRGGLDQIKAKGKKVFAFLHSGDDNAYLVACAADEIAMAPTAALVLHGFGGLFPFLKGHYQMLGIEFDVITAGRYKYPGFVNRREPDEYFKEEFNAIYDSWFNEYRQTVASCRKLSEDAVSGMIDIALFDANQAQQRGLIDTLAYYDEYRDRVLKRTRMKRQHDEDRGLADVNSIQDFVELINKELKKAADAQKAVGPKIAVLHARGPIIDFTLGSAFASTVISRDTFVKVIDDLRKNNSIKAVVLRVDSPGGSGYASDVIWQELRRLDDAKPLVVSMGSVAGSGGYYIACPGRRIFAQPSTLTGSIGVLGVFRSAWSMLNRMDYELAEVKRGARSLLGAPNRGLSPEDREFIQHFMDDFYGIFISRVAQSRRIPAEQVRKIAEGRIYTGRDALAVGLVDELGGLTQAIEAARNLANIPPSAELKIVHYPRPSSLGEFFESFSMMNMPEVAQTYARATTAARPLTFEEQLTIFSRHLEPLCWMAIPDFYDPGWTGGTDLLPSPGASAPTNDPLSQLLETWRMLERRDPR